MTSHFGKARRRTLICGAAIAAVLAATPALAQAQLANIDIAAQPMDSALRELAKQSGANLLFSPDAVRGLRAKSLQTTATPEDAARMLLAGTDLFVKMDSTGSILVTADPQSGSAAGDGADGTVAALIVTAQKREENIQDVPIAISAFTEKSLQEQKIEGGFDLLKAIPNVTFSKNNFTSYNFSIRGIGTKAVSPTTDPGVAVEFNDTPMIRNRLFEQEYFDVERVEVLRGPQGTLHGRNATSGVINVISAKPNLNDFSGWVKGEVGNYHAKRVSAMVNIPLVEDKLAIRFAGALTNRNGYGTNLYDNSDADGRDLWSGRLSLGFAPTERIRADLIWERFREDDNRQRTGKQLCTYDPGKAYLGNVEVQSPAGLGATLSQTQSIFSQGCLPGSLYDDAAFATPNGFAIPFISALAQPNSGAIGVDFDHGAVGLNAIGKGIDPYGQTTQSHDLRAFYSQIPSIYRAKADVLELNIHFDLTDSLTATSQTAYNKDSYYASQDYNRYTTLPAFTDTSHIRTGFDPASPLSKFHDLAPGGIFCDPQLGCSNTIVGQDLSQAKSTQFSQEFRLQSDFEGRVNFSLGANYTRYKTVEDYYVFFNGITMATIVSLNGGVFGSSAPDRVSLHPDCTVSRPPGGLGVGSFVCVPIENNSIANIQDYGHNYFLSRNPYKLESKAMFGEVYVDLAENIKLTAGLRYTDDKKTFTPIPSQTALTPRSYVETLSSAFFPGVLPIFRPQFVALPLSGTGYGYPAEPNIVLGWQEVTGRLGVDWRPDLGFTDETLLYAFYSRGYKGGGMNPPSVGLNYEEAAAAGIIYTPAAPPNFRPEFIDSFEVGAKNTLFGGALVLNGSAFYYDYKDYQVSKIVDRSAQNENFDARIWGLEFESVFSPMRNLRFNANVGYLNTRIADGSESLDIMNRLAGHDDWVLVKPTLTLMSNCVIPLSVAQAIMSAPSSRYPDYFAAACPGGSVLGVNYAGIGSFSQALPGGGHYNPADHPEANYGAGFKTDISGNELPNAPHWTANIGAQYSLDILTDWKLTARADAYWQSQSWSRIYNLDPYDKLHGWYNVNLSVWVERPDDDLKIELYVKNLLDDTPITDTFLNSDDSALTTNIFTLDPRLIGLSVRKGF